MARKALVGNREASSIRTPVSPAAPGAVTALALRVVVLTALLFAARLLVMTVVGLLGVIVDAAPDPVAQLPGILAGSFIFSLVLSYVATHSHLSGFRLGLLAFWLVFGIATLLAQIESVLFLQYLTSVLSPDMLVRVLVQTTAFAISCGIFVPLVHGPLFGLAPSRPANAGGSLKAMGLGEWAWKLAVLAVAYLVVYLAAGVFIFQALAGQAFAEYYHNVQLPSWFMLFQFARAMLWVLVALPVIRFGEGTKPRIALGVALCLSFLMSGFLLAPNAVMPDAIRLSHFAELTVSDFVYGLMIVWLLGRRSPKAGVFSDAGAAATAK